MTDNADHTTDAAHKAEDHAAEAIETAAAAIADLVRARGSLPMSELTALIAEQGTPLPVAVGEWIDLESGEDAEDVWDSTELALVARLDVLDEELVVDLSGLLAGRVFTHQLSEDEIERDFLLVLPDLAALWPALGTAPLDRADEWPIDDEFDPSIGEPVIKLRPGSLADHPAGSHVAVTVTPDGLHVEQTGQPESQRMAADLTTLDAVMTEVFAGDILLAHQYDVEGGPELPADTPPPRGPVDLDQFLALAMIRDPDAFRSPGWPVSDVLSILELDHDNGEIAVAGDFDSEPTVTEMLDTIKDNYDLDESQAMAVMTFTMAVHEVHDALHDWIDEQDRDSDGTDLTEADLTEADPPDVDLSAVVADLPALIDPMVAVAIAEENLTADPHLGVVLASILQSVEGQVPRRSKAGVQWLFGQCADLAGDLDAATAHYEKALTLDADFFPALRELGTLASVRGDAQRAISLLRRSGAQPEDPELRTVLPFGGESRIDVGRNDPCWCGSGKKYKRCHLGKSAFDLKDRREWLYDKLSQWARTGYGRNLILDLTLASIEPDATPEDLVSTALDPLTMDVALFEGGLALEFLERRGHGLPDDERELLDRWISTRRGLYTIETVGEAGTLSLRDLHTGDLAVVTANTDGLWPSVEPTIGDLVCLRALPAGDGLFAIGGVVRVHEQMADVTLATLALQDSDEVDPERTIQVLSNL